MPTHSIMRLHVVSVLLHNACCGCRLSADRFLIWRFADMSVPDSNHPFLPFVISGVWGLESANHQWAGYRLRRGGVRPRKLSCAIRALTWLVKDTSFLSDVKGYPQMVSFPRQKASRDTACSST